MGSSGWAREFGCQSWGDPRGQTPANETSQIRREVARSADFVGISVHVSTKNSVDTSILKRSVAIKMPRQDA